MARRLDDLGIAVTGLRYLPEGQGRWIIYAIENTDHAQFVNGQRFNVFMATP